MGGGAPRTEVVGPVQHCEEVLESKIENGRLLFRTRQDHGDEIRYEMRVESDGTALLRLVDEPDRVKPFRLKKALSEQCAGLAAAKHLLRTPWNVCGSRSAVPK